MLKEDIMGKQTSMSNKLQTYKAATNPYQKGGSASGKRGYRKNQLSLTKSMIEDCSEDFSNIEEHMTFA